MMEKEEQKFAFAVATMMGLVARGATPAEVRDMLPVYVEFALLAMNDEKLQSE